MVILIPHMATNLTFSIVTPSFRQLEWLRLNSASVLDQVDVSLEHIIQDAGTGPEFQEWAQGKPKTQIFIEKDDGMFDAINRGWRRASGKYVAQLNCDEQYLPGALARVARYFVANPQVDVLYGDSIIMDSAGNLRTYWKAVPLHALQVAAGGISNPTAAIFFRKDLLDQGFYYDPRWRQVGDAEWNRAVLAAGKKTAAPGILTSIYAVTGKNLSTTVESAREMAEWEATSPRWVRSLKWPAKAWTAIYRKLLEPRSRKIPEVAFYRPGQFERRHCIRQIDLSTRWPVDLYSDKPPEALRQFSDLQPL